jgi:hypothetical protein
MPATLRLDGDAVASESKGSRKVVFQERIAPLLKRDVVMFLDRPYRLRFKFFVVGLLISVLALTGIMYLVSRIDIIKIWNSWIRLFGA